jgi:hypothetical protein
MSTFTDALNDLNPETRKQVVEVVTLLEQVIQEFDKKITSMEKKLAELQSELKTLEN